MPRILVTPAVYQDGRGPWREVLDAAKFDIVIPPSDAVAMDAHTLIKHLAGIDGVLASVEHYSRHVLESSKLRAIARVGVGYDSIDVAAATERGVAIAITPGTNHHSVAEQAIAMITSIFRDLAARDHEIRRGVWRRNPVRRLAGNTLGLVGFGRIGKAITPRALGLGLKVIAYDPFPDRAYAEQYGVRLVSLEELLPVADIVSLHLPCTSETADIINSATLTRMKRGAVLINTSRGGLVDEDALLAALNSGQVSHAGLDVLKVEPPLHTHPLLQLSNVTLAPHLGGIDQEALDAMGVLAAQCLVDLHRGQWPEGCIVNEGLKAGWKW